MVTYKHIFSLYSLYTSATASLDHPRSITFLYFTVHMVVSSGVGWSNVNKDAKLGSKRVILCDTLLGKNVIIKHHMVVKYQERSEKWFV